MLEQMKAMGAIAGLLKNKQRLREIADEVKAQLECERVIGESGAGAVRIVMTCRLHVESVELAPALTPGPQAQRLVAEAMNQALERAQDRAKEIISGAAKDLGLPDLPGLGSLLT